MDERPKERRIEERVERRIRELRDSGALSDLPGEGAPLPPDPDENAGDEWAARHVLRTSGARPEWGELRREIAERRARLVTRLRAHGSWLERRAELLQRAPAERIAAETAATRDADARVRREIAAAVDELNGLTRRHNLLVTSAALHLRTMTAEGLREVARATEHREFR